MRHDNIHEAFRGILHMIMPIPPGPTSRPTISDSERQAIWEHHREEYDCGLDSVDDDDMGEDNA